LTTPYTKYAYEPAENGQYTSLYGDKLSKIYKFKKGQEGLFESDVPETTRVLVDMYTDSDEVSTGIVVMPFDIEVETETGAPNIKTAENEITAISLHDSATDQYWVLVLNKDGTMQERTTSEAIVLPFQTEHELLMKFLEIYEEIHPDIITGWNIDYFDIPYIYNRLKRVLGDTYANRLSPIGKMFYSDYRDRWFIAGVSCLDYMVMYKKFTFGELPNYRLDTVARLELGEGKIEYQGNLDELFRTNLDKFIEYSLVDTKLIVKFEKKLQFIELARGICHAGHVPYEDIVYSSKYLEGALLTYLKQRGIVAPNKKPKTKLIIKKGISGETRIYVRGSLAEIPNTGTLKINKSKSSKILIPYIGINREQGYFETAKPLPETLDKEWGVVIDLMGAYVKDPITGRYEWIYDLDLTSLYPMIIITLNISPETKVLKIDNWDYTKYLSDDDYKIHVGDHVIPKSDFKKYITDNEMTISANGVVYRTDIVGCIPGILNIWFDKRVEYKGLMKKYGIANDTEKYNYYNKRQHVQKILLNSLYGVLGLYGWRFYDVDNAGATTSSGQLIIKSTADMGNTKYNNELSSPERIQVQLEDGTTKQYNLTEYIKVVRNGELAEIMAKDLVMTDELS
jgi:DNA polymerase elongation subunit (family B)